ncbi:hypothetical protein CANINC_001158 [Pichia inconspicua]|uniref:OTU domain-containing protein n=1 Tax=Pichia inconspicua TaxID=52247 RepID=A0A4T0X4D0_9ASCO|nr:hypothetical protein CANINC_001158 [[Candida] inconspicua]
MCETEDELIARQRKEVKELTGKITAMRKQANKNTKKAVLKEIQELEESLRSKHEKELANLKTREVGELEQSAVDPIVDNEEVTPESLLAKLDLDDKSNSIKSTVDQPKKKRNRQKERLAKREAEIRRIQEEAKEEQNHEIDYRGIEMKNIQDLCDVQRVKQHDITPDGHCLFSSISDQLKIRHDIDVPVKQLRKQAGTYILQHPDDFIPFLFDEETMSLKNIDEYVEKIVNTAMWGGDLEILALSKVYDCPISVMMSGRATLKMNEEGSNPELKLVYYKHAFGLGEHYNSLHDI